MKQYITILIETQQDLEVVKKFIEKYGYFERSKIEINKYTYFSTACKTFNWDSGISTFDFLVKSAQEFKKLVNYYKKYDTWALTLT